MYIRAFQPSDQESLIDLWASCGLTTPSNDPALDIQRKLAVDADLLLVGFASEQTDARLLASVMGGYEGHRGWINYLAVAPGSQRHGYASQMMKAIEQRLLERGAAKINLQVRHGNAAALAFYKRLGYLEDAVVSLGKRVAD